MNKQLMLNQETKLDDYVTVFFLQCLKNFIIFRFNISIVLKFTNFYEYTVEAEIFIGDLISFFSLAV